MFCKQIKTYDFVEIYPTLQDFVNDLNPLHPFDESRIAIIWQILSLKAQPTLYEKGEGGVEKAKRAFKREYMRNISTLETIFAFWDKWSADNITNSEVQIENGKNTREITRDSFIKSANTPTAVDPSEVFIDRYSDAQTKGNESTTNEGSNDVTKTKKQNPILLYKRIIKGQPIVVQLINNCFSHLFMSVIESEYFY